MRKFLFVVAAASAVCAAHVPVAEAQFSNSRNPWCIRDGVSGHGTWDCSYYNQRQCLQSASGAGGWCVPNPNYQPRRGAPRR